MTRRIAFAAFALWFLAATPAFADEVTKIRTHLLEVEEHLRARDVSDWPAELREARQQRLDELHDYAIAGAFPKNTRHPGGETPYFIDDYGTACAVGHLMIESGAEDAARAIAARENNAYVMEMTSPEIAGWIRSSGLTAEEAAWIQPGYDFVCDTLDPLDVEVTGPETVACGEKFDLTATRPPEGTQCFHRYEWAIEGDGGFPEVATLGFDGEMRVEGEFGPWTEPILSPSVAVRFPENVFSGTYTATLTVTRENGDSQVVPHSIAVECDPGEPGNSDPGDDGTTVDPDTDDEPFEEESACSTAGTTAPLSLVLLAVFIFARRRRTD